MIALESELCYPTMASTNEECYNMKFKKMTSSVHMPTVGVHVYE